MRGLWVRVAVALLCLGIAKSGAADEVADHKAFMALRQRLRQVEQQNPKDAVAQYGAFLQQQPDLSPWVGVIVCSVVTDLHHKGLKDAKTALETCDWAAKRYAAHPAVIAIHVDKARVLVAEKRGAEAEALLKEHWERVVQARGNHANAAIWEYCAALEQQGKPDEVIALLKKSLLAIPALLDDNQQTNRGWIYERLADTLIKQKAFDEALQWGKVRFIEAPFDEASIQRSTRMLSRIWAAKDPAAPTARGFFEALTDPARPNPLVEVKLPPVDAEARTAQLSRLQGGWRQVHERISLQILAGELGPAIMDARQLMVDKPELPAGVQEVCRVLKAADLNLKRANQFIEFVKTGTGPNPLEQFLKEQEQKGGVKAGAREPLSKKEWAAIRRHSAAGLKRVAGGPNPPAPFPTREGGVPRLPAAAVPPPVQLGEATTSVAAISVVGIAGSDPGVAAVGIPGLPQAPAAVGGSLATGALPAIVQERALKAPEILAALVNGGSSPEEAWASGVLTADDLERAVGQVQLGKDYDDRGFRLAGLLAVHFPERAKDLARLSPRVRLRLAGYYRTQRDPRAVDLYEQLLVECRSRPGLIQPALNGLAQYYRNTGEVRQAAETYLRAEQVTEEGPVIANSLVEAARLYMGMGDERKADELYAQVAKHGYGWATGLAMLDAAALLSRREQYDRARSLLEREIAGRYADQIAIPVLSRLADVCHRQGDTTAARAYWHQVIAKSQNTELLRNDGLECFADIARRRLALVDSGRGRPLSCDTPEVYISCRWGGGPVQRSVLLRSQERLGLSIIRGDERVKAEVAECEVPGATRAGPTTYRLVLEVLPESLRARFRTSLVVGCAGRPDVRADLSVIVDVQSPVRASSPYLLLSPDGESEGTRHRVRLRAPIRFQILSISADDAAVRVHSSSEGSATEHELACSVGSGVDPEWIQGGLIHVKTDIEDWSVVEVPYLVLSR